MTNPPREQANPPRWKKEPEPVGCFVALALSLVAGAVGIVLLVLTTCGVRIDFGVPGLFTRIGLIGILSIAVIVAGIAFLVRKGK